MICKECGDDRWIEYPITYKQCKSCGHFQINTDIHVKEG